MTLSPICFIANPNWQIKELKSDFGPGSSLVEEEDLTESNREPSQDNSIFSLISPPNLETVLQSLPARQIVDRRLSVYFKAKYAIVRKSGSPLPVYTS